ncbi:MAG: PLP-dependent aspartate aminotransferase family protein [Candidatus Kryptonium sp.]|nr:PLP-dependent aspartate aminotransferase family protein [Candidatus Kryptonium sp.]MCX7762926.1 PLP-dependent aspartate aminotransferase family protein [Candidatus Kryptonium sp.]MDW8109753.1 PLP-dependent aspartate aminotransferase family protein [Candidatus Kryptonium sp.]
MGFSTDAIHFGQKPDKESFSVIPPIYPATTYARKFGDENAPYVYSRTQNPNRKMLEENIAKLENGKYAFAFSSGVAAVTAVMQLLKPGDHVVTTKNIYGGTLRVFKEMQKWGINFSFVDMTSVENVESAIRDETKMIFAETPSNPLLYLTDLKRLSELRDSINKEILIAVDNTFMTPYLQRPLELGCDIVIHSSTKFLNGHSDVVGGIVVINREELQKPLWYIQRAFGAVPSPFDCWLLLRSIKTLAVRMKQHCHNAKRVAIFLASHPKVERVFYPGLPSHPQYELAQSQMKDFGGIVTIDLGSIENVRKFLDALKIFTLAESLGGVESLVNHSWSMSHSSVPDDEKRELGLTEGMLRLSVGIEDVEDLISDLEQALDKI